MYCSGHHFEGMYLKCYGSVQSLWVALHCSTITLYYILQYGNASIKNYTNYLISTALFISFDVNRYTALQQTDPVGSYGNGKD